MWGNMDLSQVLPLHDGCRGVLENKTKSLMWGNQAVKEKVNTIHLTAPQHSCHLAQHPEEWADIHIGALRALYLMLVSQQSWKEKQKRAISCSSYTMGQNHPKKLVEVSAQETGTQGGCRLDFTSTSVLFIFASLQYYQLLLHMDDPYCALVKWYHIMLLCFYHQTLLMKKSPGLPRFICSIYFPKTLFWIKHLR